MPKKLLIGFGHRRRRGKDTCCDYIVDRCKEFHPDERPFIRDSFAHSLKEGIGKGVFGLSDEQVHTSLKKEVDPYWGMTPREILQKAGTEAMRNVFGGSIWVKTLMRRIESREESTVISDVRFRNEADAIREAGGFVIRIDRAIKHDPEIDDHPSEKDLSIYYGWDYVIKNVNSFSTLYSQVEEVLSKIFERVNLNEQIEEQW